jgi:hypothetical protein
MCCTWYYDVCEYRKKDKAQKRRNHTELQTLVTPGSDSTVTTQGSGISSEECPWSSLCHRFPPKDQRSRNIVQEASPSQVGVCPALWIENFNPSSRSGFLSNGTLRSVLHTGRTLAERGRGSVGWHSL